MSVREPMDIVSILKKPDETDLRALSNISAVLADPMSYAYDLRVSADVADAMLRRRKATTLQVYRVNEVRLHALEGHFRTIIYSKEVEGPRSLFIIGLIDAIG